VPTTAPGVIARSSLTLLLLAGALVATPALADTKSELEAARERLAEVQARLNQATAAWQHAESLYEQTRAEISATRATIAGLQERIREINDRLEARARQAFENGAGGTIELLLSSASFADFSDRLEFLGSMAESDATLVIGKRVATEELRRRQSDLTRLSDRQAATVSTLNQRRAEIDADLADMQAMVDDLTARYRSEQAARQELALLGQTPLAGAALQVCPVAGPNSFADSFGWPRPGGRTHQGIDMMAALGTPVVAAQSGNAVRAPNSLGGLAVIVYAANGDWTYYAHLSGYAASGPVSAGTTIGYVGNTGDASGGPYHLHFEYHPGGGAAIDPYAYLLAVC